MQTLPQTGPITRVAQQFQNTLAGDSIKPPAQRNPLATAMQEQALLGFAEGGEVKETAEQLMARMAAKYGTSGAAQSAPVAVTPPPAPQPQSQPTPAPQKGIGGVVGLLKWRGKQIDEAAGYANGGKIKGPGTPTSDSIPARVKQTGATIAVSTKERIVSEKQDVLLENLAKNLGFPSLDAMLEAGTGRPVGPTIKGGTLAAANGLNPDENPLAAVSRSGNSFSQNLAAPQPAITPSYMGRDARADQRQLDAAPIAAPGTPAPVARDRFGNDMTQTNAMKAQLGESPISEPSSVMNPLASVASGMQERTFQATSPIAAPAVPTNKNPLTTIDIAGDNATMARANTIRQPMIDSGATGPKVTMLEDSGRKESQALMDKWGREDQSREMMQAIARDPKSANALASMFSAQVGSDATRNGQALAQTTAQVANETTRRGQDVNASIASEGHGVTARGQDITAKTHAAQLAGNPLDNALKQVNVDSSKQHIEDVARLNAETDPAKRQIMIENLLTAQGKNATSGERLTLPMLRSNAEIDAARKLVAGLSPEEIKRRTAKQTNTGRDNPDFDPTLEHAMTLSNRRKVGADDVFDQRPQPGAQQPQGTAGDAITRFRADPSMKDHRLGKLTENGTEVFDSTGKLIGHYR